MERYRDMSLVSISHDQRRPLTHLDLRWMTTVYHGLPESAFAVGPGSGGYLAFISRIAPEKRLDLAIAVARRLSLPLKIAGKVDEADRPYLMSKFGR